MKLLKHSLPCDDCGSSDALAEYENGSYCFSCGEYHPHNEVDAEVMDLYLPDLQTITYDDFVGARNRSGGALMQLLKPKLYTKTKPVEATITEIKNYRGLTPDTLKAYGCTMSTNLLVMPYGPKARKIRMLDKKDFYAEGEFQDSNLFGQDKFDSGGLAITITEGELDAMSVYQMFGSKYPSISIKGASSARRDLKKSFEYINSFQKIYLCFDNDEPGQKALADAATLFNPNKVYHVKMDKYKDANDYLTHNDSKAFISSWYNAKPYLPEGIVGDYDSIKDILNKADSSSVATYPFQKLNEQTYGIRLGECVLLTAQEKVGKTEVLRAIEHHLLKTTDYNLGIIHLEETEKRSVQGLIGYELDSPVHLPDSGISVEDALKAYKGLTKRDNRTFFYAHFGSDDPDIILDRIRYMAAVCDCKFIFLDHITMLVTGFEGDDERKKLDYLSTRLAMLTRELNFTLFLISHVNDDGKTRGSRNISKIADLIIFLDRDIEAETIEQRNKTTLMVKGNRFAGLSGPSSVLMFDNKSYKLREVLQEDTVEETKEFSKFDTSQRS